MLEEEEGEFWLEGGPMRGMEVHTYMSLNFAYMRHALVSLFVNLPVS